ncbi:MAG: hypothetical protein J0L60_12580 [Ignavibacteria bacterium]|nr:hypothetical protein [Ignavibacteria bacterium]
MKKSQVYFIMYIVLITELLIVITERDELMEKEEQIKIKMISSIADQYKRDIELTAPIPYSEWQIGTDSVKIPISATGLVSDEEKKSSVYVVKSDGGKSPGSGAFPSELTSASPAGPYSIVKDVNGNATIEILKVTSIGEYEFTAYLKVKRQLPTYLPAFLLEELKKASGFKEGQEVTTKPVKIKIKVKTEPPAQQPKKGDVINVGPSID